MYYYFDQLPGEVNLMVRELLEKDFKLRCLTLDLKMPRRIWMPCYRSINDLAYVRECYWYLKTYVNYECDESFSFSDDDDGWGIDSVTISLKEWLRCTRTDYYYGVPKVFKAISMADID
jgi:hypothetical protein